MPLFRPPHRRWNPLTGEWVLVSPHRTERPWQGRTERSSTAQRPVHDPACYLCPGNPRAGAAVNPEYTGTYAFANDFPALLPESLFPQDQTVFFRQAPARGTCRVLCFSPRHDLTLAEMERADIRRVVDAWAEQEEDLGRKYQWVQVFENKGETMGCSNPHPHGQIWACDYLPTEIEKEDFHQRIWFEKTGRPLIENWLAEEAAGGERMVTENKEWAAAVPFWAVWPFETLVAPKRPTRRLSELDQGQRDALAAVLKDLLVRYDQLFGVSFPYSMGWHGAPTDGRDHPHWRLHAHFYPPLLRSESVRKFMVGFEMLAEPQRDLTPEESAERLRRLPGAQA